MKTQNNKTNIKAIIYARVATYTQANYGGSLDNQIKKIENYCKKNNYIVVDTISEVKSGYKNENNLLLNAINKQKGKVIVCIDKIDRLSRNTFDKNVSLLYEKAINSEIELHFVSDSQIINDKMSAGDKFSFGMKLGLAKHYSDVISNNVKRAFEQKRKNGEWIGKAPFGYINVKDNKGKPTIIVDKEKSKLVQLIFKLQNGNSSISEILKKLKEKYPNDVLTLSKGLKSYSIYRIIKNEDFYKGYINFNGKKYTHKYSRLIS